MDYSTMEAGSEMDRLVAERVMGWTMMEVFEPIMREAFLNYVDAETGIGMCSPDEWNPSDDISSAWEVVEKLDNPSISLITAFGLWTCEGRGDTFYKATADTAPLAICRAALMAVKLYDQ